MKQFYILPIIVLILSFTGYAHAYEGGGGDREYPFDRQYKPSPPEMVTWNGFVKCENESHAKTGECDMIFIDKNADEFDIIESPDLLRVHCSKHTDLEVRLTAEKTPSFLFWGGDLKVAKFDVVREVNSEEIPKKPESNLHHRMRDFEGGYN